MANCQLEQTDTKVLDEAHGDKWSLYHGDCCELIKALPDASIDYVWSSLPFLSIFVYSPSERDVGNCRNSDEFWQHFAYLTDELYRVMKPGRICSIHCMNVPTSKQNHGFIGIQDFRGDIIRDFQRAGFIYHSEAVIHRDPVVDMQRTKALGLLHKQVKKDSCMSRQGIPDTMLQFAKDYVGDEIKGDATTALLRLINDVLPSCKIDFRKGGENAEPVSGEFKEFYGDASMMTYSSMQSSVDGEEYTDSAKSTRKSIDIWQRYADPIWMDIDRSDTLQFKAARTDDDGRHVCPAQIGAVKRSMDMFSNPGDTVLDPFNGVGTTGHAALQMGRRYIGFELKDSYFKQAVKNLTDTEASAKQPQLELN